MSFGKGMTWLHGDIQFMTLFDLDGTLTEPRQPMDKKIMPALRKLSAISGVGIVSGSDYNYLLEQAAPLILQSEIRYNLHLFPCNGTKHYTPPEDNTSKHKKVHDASMKDRIGDQVFNQLVSYLLGRQARLRYSGIPLTGHFVDYRGSMINWCPIGRNAENKDRAFFVDYDKAYDVRIQELQSFRDFIELNDLSELITIKLGGSTSFDIYPKGWDKTYCLRHLEGKQCIFVGDRCEPSGNDYELWKHLSPAGHGFETESVDETIEIIEEFIIPLIMKRRKS